MRYILAHDLGTSSNKAIVTDERGEIVASVGIPYEVRTLRTGWAEQSPETWWDAVCRSSRAVVARAGIEPEEVEALCFAGQMQGTLPVDASGQPLTDAMIWLDARAERQARAATRGWIRMRGYGLRRLLRWLRLTNGAPTLSGKDPVAKMLWIRECRPEVWARTHKLLDAKDFLLFRSTGRYVTSFDCGNSTWLMDTRPGRLDWSDSLLRMLELPRERLPDLVPGTEVVGELLPEAAKEMGIRSGIPVVAGAGDVASMAVGTGTVRDHDVHLAIGTSAWLAAHVPGRRRHPTAYVASICSAHAGKQLLVAHQETGGACVEWARSTLGGAIASGNGAVHYKDLDALVERYEPGAEGLLFLPWLAGEYAPVDDPRLRAGFVNLALRHEIGHMVRAVYEGVALNARWALSKVEGMVGGPPESLRFAGGGAASEVWCQILADALGRPVVQFDRPHLAAARGAALIAGHALGWVPHFEDIAELVQGRARYEPRGEFRGLYDERYGQFVDFYRRNRGFYAAANALARS